MGIPIDDNSGLPLITTKAPEKRLEDEGGCQVVIYIAETVEYCYSNEDGAVIYRMIKKPLSEGQVVTLSFKGVGLVSSSFINSALLPLLDDHEFEWIKDNLKIINSTKYINDLIKNIFRLEVENMSALREMRDE